LLILQRAGDKMDAKVLGVSFLCEACAEGLGLETDAELTQARCRECGQVKACLATVKPRDPGEEPSPAPG